MIFGSHQKISSQYYNNGAFRLHSCASVERLALADVGRCKTIEVWTHHNTTVCAIATLWVLSLCVYSVRYYAPNTPNYTQVAAHPAIKIQLSVNALISAIEVFTTRYAPLRASSRAPCWIFWNNKICFNFVSILFWEDQTYGKWTYLHYCSYGVIRLYEV